MRPSPLGKRARLPAATAAPRPTVCPSPPPPPLAQALWWVSAWMASWDLWYTSFYSWVQGYTGMFAPSQLNPIYWLLLLLISVAGVLPQLYVHIWQRTFYPEFRDLAREAEYARRLHAPHLAPRRMRLLAACSTPPHVSRRRLDAGTSIWIASTCGAGRCRWH